MTEMIAVIYKTSQPCPCPLQDAVPLDHELISQHRISFEFWYRVPAVQQHETICNMITFVIVEVWQHVTKCDDYTLVSLVERLQSLKLCRDYVAAGQLFENRRRLNTRAALISDS